MKTLLAPKINLFEKETFLAKDFSSSIANLKIVLGMEMSLLLKTKMFLLSASKGNFKELEKILDNQYLTTDKVTTEVLDMMTKLGDKFMATSSELIDYSIFNKDINERKSRQIYLELITDHERIIIQLKIFIQNAKASKHLGMISFLNNILDQHKSKIYILKKYTCNYIFYNL